MFRFDPIRFRGEQAVIRARLKKYLRYIPQKGKVLDLACGRGELLALCRERNIEAVGVENSKERVADCRKQGLTVVEEDAFCFLKQSTEQYEAIVASHFIEHLFPEKLFELLELIYLRLKPGGRLILIWPNFQSPFVAFHLFWLDPTHVRPYPRELLCAVLEENGFVIKASGEDPDTLPLSRKSFFSSFLFRRLFPFEASFLHRACDVYLVAEKCR